VRIFSIKTTKSRKAKQRIIELPRCVKRAWSPVETRPTTRTKVTDSVVKAMADKQPLRVIFRDSCFEQDADKINIYETFKQLLDWSDKDVEKIIRVV